MSAFNQRYPNLFNTGHEDSSESGEEGGEGESDGDESAFVRRWGWIANVDAVSELVRCPWNDVWEMNVMEFFNLLSYRKDKIEHDRNELEKWRRMH